MACGQRGPGRHVNKANLDHLASIKQPQVTPATQVTPARLLYGIKSVGVCYAAIDSDASGLQGP